MFDMVYNNGTKVKKVSYIYLYKDSKQLNRLKKGAVNTAEMHTVKYFAERVLDVYKIAIKKHPKSIIPLIEKIRKHKENNNE